MKEPTNKKTLRYQLWRLACREVNSSWAEIVSIDGMIKELCARAFYFCWKQSLRESKILRRAWFLITEEGGISVDEPSVKTKS